MSFDVYLQRFQRGEPVEADREAVASVLSDLKATGPDRLGYYHVLVSDLWEMVAGQSGGVTELEIVGGPEAAPGPEHRPYSLEFSAHGVDGQDRFDCCSFFLHAFSPGIAEVIFRIASAGRMAIMPAAQIGPLLPPTTDPGDLPEEMSYPPHRVASGSELFSALSGAHGRYERWRDRVIPRTPGRQPLLRTLFRVIRGRG